MQALIKSCTCICCRCTSEDCPGPSRARNTGSSCLVADPFGSFSAVSAATRDPAARQAASLVSGSLSLEKAAAAETAWLLLPASSSLHGLQQ